MKPDAGQVGWPRRGVAGEKQQAPARVPRSRGLSVWQVLGTNPRMCVVPGHRWDRYGDRMTGQRDEDSRPVQPRKLPARCRSVGLVGAVHDRGRRPGSSSVITPAALGRRLNLGSVEHTLASTVTHCWLIWPVEISAVERWRMVVPSGSRSSSTKLTDERSATGSTTRWTMWRAARPSTQRAIAGLPTRSVGACPTLSPSVICTSACSAYNATWYAEFEDSMASIRPFKSNLVCVLKRCSLPEIGLAEPAVLR